MAFSLPAKTIDLFNSIVTNFLWQSKVHPLEWKSICRPKKEGGLGLRLIADLCRAATAKRIWTLLNNKDSIWGQWMYQKYLKGQKNFWITKPSKSDSPVWKEI